jgi:phosphatidylserine decarboxylase
MSDRLLTNKLEEVRQAWRIHGGIVTLCAAALGVRLARVKIPSRRLRLLVYRTLYGKKYPALDETELEQPLWAYPSLNALFTRGVRPECRPIAATANDFLCPCDGTVQEIGKIDQEQRLTVKDTEYNLASLLPGIAGDAFHGGHFAIIFLSPRDCHRVFSPQAGRIEEVVHVPGYRLLVHPPYQRKEFPVFTLNERVIIRWTTPRGACALVLVAGWGVGNITLCFDPSFRPNGSKLTRKTYAGGLAVNRADWVATFELGSTTILLTEPADCVTLRAVHDQQVRYGQPLFSFP